MQVFNYSTETGEFTGATVARPDPREAGKFLVPGSATTTPPPDAAAGEIAVFNDGAWSLVSDNRGAEYWTVTDNLVSAAQTITELGEAFPAGAVLVYPGARPTADHEWNGAAWVYVAPTDDERMITPVQFEFLLSASGLEEVWAALEADLKATDPATYAGLRAERVRPRFYLDKTLALVATFRDQASALVPGADLSESAIRAAWEQAEAFEGLA